MTTNRRNWLYTALMGGGALGLKALATGVPIKMLTDPLSASAQDLEEKLLVMSRSNFGEPLNAYVPGSFDVSNRFASTNPRFQEVDMEHGGQMHRAGACWRDLAPSVLDQTCFFHHSTYTNNHSNETKVQRLMGSTVSRDMYISDVSKHLSEQLGTIQREPVGTVQTRQAPLTFDGRPLGAVTPRALKSAFLPPEDELQRMIIATRDAQLDRMNGILKEQGTPNQRLMLDRFATSREQAARIPEAVLGLLADIQTGLPTGRDYISAALAIMAMKITPVTTIRLGFGGDNHGDGDLSGETTAHLSSLADIEYFWERVGSLRRDGLLSQDVLFVVTTVFGRTLQPGGEAGRSHNGNHNMAVLMGEGVKPGVIGGVQELARDVGATPFNSQTGSQSMPDVPVDESLESLAKTMGVLLGLPRETVDEQVYGGTVVDAAIAS